MNKLLTFIASMIGYLLGAILMTIIYFGIIIVLVTIAEKCIGNTILSIEYCILIAILLALLHIRVNITSHRRKVHWGLKL